MEALALLSAELNILISQLFQLLLSKCQSRHRYCGSKIFALVLVDEPGCGDLWFFDTADIGIIKQGRFSLPMVGKEDDGLWM